MSYLNESCNLYIQNEYIASNNICKGGAEELLITGHRKYRSLLVMQGRQYQKLK